ncbi:type IV toxin-antitoxin system AbiEi family antitoxin domain-containing protein [Rhodococcus sp. H29-C3]|uniref:type IV toxin-antitoxin system AbiEi family antitoxin domain-containing protein n=1 Tax=Rhodococcus sp. H29-C3 TaxID=3046307 RepID=UPI0024B8B14E|nr:type IV toxin-antitoxin system AbiEi family antitoxin domain-containing protein [Rhodococcus sp. H29-C3]MDJ0363042.1 type IV toxin-antitoxin system AbiEi family antitoxin domain-containing protein [Rhodococcus sp. H29-C3]
MSDEWSELREVSRNQFWLFTAAQARHRRFRTYQLARAVDRNVLVRVHHGVYGFVDAEGWCPFENVAAQWLALDPGADIDARRGAPEVIVSHESAGSIRGMGTIASYGVDLTSPRRINVRDPHTRTYRRPLGERGVDWDLYEGLPVATETRVITDLAEKRIDGGDLGTVVRDCIDYGTLSADTVVGLLAPYAARWNLPAFDGTSLLELLLWSCREPVGA